jgi:hypothetical protein
VQASQSTVEVQPVPEPTFDEMMTQWYKLLAEIKPIREQLKPLIEAEQKLRQNIIAAVFKPEEGQAFVEGVKYRDLGQGWRLQATLKVERKVIEDSITEEVKSVMRERGINLDELLRVKHEVNVKPMRQLTAEQAKLFDTLLYITQPMPTMEIIPPK